MAGDARTLAVGLAGGTAATMAMSAAMLVAGRAGAMGEYPPERIARAGLVHADRGPIAAEQLDGIVGAALHLGFGAAIGAGFATLVAPGLGRLRARLPGHPPPALLLPAAGVTVATGVWVVSYGGWIPALGLLPPVTRDRLDRQVAMLLAHWVFGAVLGASVAALARGPDRAADL